MDSKVNVTYITLSGYVDLNKFRYFYFSVIFTVYILIICSNATILYLIWVHKNLHEPMYVFIAGLLFNCLLYSTNIYPKLLVDFLSEEPKVSYSACLLQFFMFYSVEAQSSLLAAMAFNRYVAICKPLRYKCIMKRSTVSALLILAWCFPACHLAVLAILSAKAKLCNFNLDGIICNNKMYTVHCVRSRALTVFGVVALFDFAILPTLFTVFTYAKIFVTSYRSCKESRKTAVQTCVPHLFVLTSYFCVMTYDVIVARVEADFSRTAGFVMTIQTFLYHPLINPFMYGFKMKEINKHLKTLLCSAKA
ncbi:olfactory receptor 11A1-like [Poeciliopsis prolifica]|uniref:olfactory receptor 11A1-like n=1 Tax=Poeciliopsis prolifica TaxID=188132 RepID=UPI002413B83B|nr:olfactory receptor 11A1-like [Poeciliopsis prolifica]